MAKLERDEAAADEQDAFGQRIEPHELGAVGKVFGAGNIYRPRLGTRCDQEMVCLKLPLAVDFDGIFADEARFPVKGSDAVALQTVFDPTGHFVGERLREGDQIGPVDGDVVRFDALAVHEPRCVDDFRPAAEHFLRIAAAQGAGAAIRQFVDHRDRPTG